MATDRQAADMMRNAGKEAAETSLVFALADVPQETNRAFAAAGASTTLYIGGINSIVGDMRDAMRFDMDNPSALTLARLNTDMRAITDAAGHSDRLGRALQAEQTFVMLAAQDAVMDAEDLAVARAPVPVIPEPAPVNESATQVNKGKPLLSRFKGLTPD